MKNIDELNVIFVDDEQAILDAIRRVLRPLYPRWRTQFIANPLAALQLLKQQSSTLDAIVCDINMPGINGLQILQAVTEHYPAIIRIALTGQLDIKTVLGTSKYADCQLCKPVNIDQLSSSIVEHYRRRHGSGRVDSSDKNHPPRTPATA